MTEDEKKPDRSEIHLRVLPSSGKVDQLRREIQTDLNAAPDSRDVSMTESGRTPGGPAVPTVSGKTIQQKLLEGKVIEALRQVYDPELPVNIYDLGLIYEIDAGEDNSVRVKMTLTAPACPVAGSLPGEVERKIEAIPDVKSADVELVWDPPWDRSRMSEAAQLELGLF